MIAWFARNGVAANLLMLLIVASGLYSLTQRLPLEVFPSFELDRIDIRVSFRGATPAEVEEGVVIKIEQAIHELPGVKELRSKASEGSARVTVDVATGYNARRLLDDVKQRVDGIATFPGEIERPVIYIPQREREVISVIISGHLSERELRTLGERVRDELLNLPEITRVDLDAVRDYELAIEVAEATLRRHGLTLESVARAIERSSLDLSAGAIRTAGGDVLVRTKGQAYEQADFESIVVLSRADGTRLTLADIAQVNDGFEETATRARCNGLPCVLVDVFRVGNQNAITVADSVKRHIGKLRPGLPQGVEIGFWRDRSQIVKARLNTLLNSAIQGGALVLLLLTLFLRWSVAFWVFIGVPVCFMGGIALMPQLGVTVNIVSLFAFILVLGIVVDDAIVTGENIYSRMKTDPDRLAAAIDGTKEVAVPVTFGVLTTVVAFLPMLMIEGVRGKIFSQIPLIVIPVLLFSLVESKLILPSHMKHLKIKEDPRQRHNILVRLQRKVADGLETAIRVVYRPVLAAAIRQRYFTLSLFVATAVLVYGVVMGGYLRFVFFPRVQSEVAVASLAMPDGTPFEVTDRHIEKMTAAARRLRDKYVDQETGESVIENILSISGSWGQAHRGRVRFQIVSPEQRSVSVTSSELVREWRRAIGAIAGAKELSYRAEIGRGGDPIDVQLIGNDFDSLRDVADRIKQRLVQYPGVFDVSDSFQEGKEEIQLKIKPEAELLGLSLADLARQVRQAFLGFEVQRIQRGREDVRVVVRYPENQRRSLDNLESMPIRTPEGVEVPFAEVAEAKLGRSFSTINRINRSRTVNVRADANKESTDIEGIKADLRQVIGDLVATRQGIDFSLEGEAREQRESFGSLKIGLWFVLFVVYGLLAIPFRSYVQPLMVMSVIPFGVVGAVLGHLIMGHNLSIISACGMLALSGVVVNDSLVLVDYINRRRREGVAVLDAVLAAGVARFRAVMLTSLTTFAGLMPLIFEKSTQAQFLIPMALSLGFGILFATFITLLLIPINYVILEDLTNVFRKPAVAGGSADTSIVGADR